MFESQGTRRFLLGLAASAACVAFASMPARASCGGAASPRVQAPGEPINVVSWNAHGLPWPFVKKGSERLDQLVARIREEGADIAMLQEIWAGAWRTLERSAGGDFTLVREKGLFGWSRGGLVVLVRKNSDWQIDPQSVRFRKYHTEAPAWRVWEGDGLANKGALFFDLMNRRTGRSFALVDTHLQAGYHDAKTVEVRARQLDELTGWVKQLGSRSGVLVGGDLNAAPSEATLHERVMGLGVDLASEFRAPPGALRQASGPPTVRRDYVLLYAQSPQDWQAKASILDKRSPGIRVSDHHGLAVDLTPPVD